MENNTPLEGKQYTPDPGKKRGRPHYKAKTLTMRGYLVMAGMFILLLMGLLAATLYGNYAMQAELNSYRTSKTIDIEVAK